MNGWSSSVFHLWSISVMILSITSLSFSSFDKSSSSFSFDVIEITLWIIWIWISRNWHQRDESKNDSVFNEDNIDLRLEINIFNPFKSRLSWLFLNYIDQKIINTYEKRIPEYLLIIYFNLVDIFDTWTIIDVQQLIFNRNQSSHSRL